MDDFHCYKFDPHRLDLGSGNAHRLPTGAIVLHLCCSRFGAVLGRRTHDRRLVDGEALQGEGHCGGKALERCD